MRSAHFLGLNVSVQAAAGMVHATAATGVAVAVAGTLGWLPPLVTIVAGLGAILFYAFQIWESKTIKSRMRLHRRRWVEQQQLAAQAIVAAELLKSTAARTALELAITSVALQSAPSPVKSEVNVHIIQDPPK